MPSTKCASTVALLAICIGCSSSPAGAQQRDGLLGGLTSRTFGGPYVWSDEVVYRDWRIQKHVMIGHYRLIDPDERRVTFGSFDECLDKLQQAKADVPIPPLPKEVVVVLHGLGASRGYMNGLSTYLEEQGGLTVVNVGYPSTMAEIDQHAATLDSVVRHLDGVERISFVAHSMGNIVIRRFLHDVERLTPAMRPQVEFKRMVMISPPNHGAQMADALGDRKIVQFFGGEPVEQLAPQRGWPKLEQKLATPDFPFGIIAGGSGDDSGFLPAIPGDDDMLLSVATMKLDGAADFVQIKGGVHQLMPKYKDVRSATLNFLRHGYFVSEDVRQPLASAPSAGQ